MNVKDNEKKKIVFFTVPLKFFVSHRLPIALRAKKDGYEVHVISVSSDEKLLVEENGLIFHHLDINRKGANLFSELKTIYSIYKLYKKISPDIVHHVTIKPLIYGTLAARLSKVPAVVNAFSGLGYVFTASGLKVSVIRSIVIFIYRIVLRHDNMTSIVQNKDDLAYLTSQDIINENKTVMIKGSGVDLKKFTPTVEPTEYFMVIFPARLLKDKGIVEFCEAAKILQQKKMSVRMVLVGDIDLGNPSSISKEALSEWEEKGIIEYWGFTNDMPEVMSRTNIVCLPSYREGMPKSLIEATAAGRAIITTYVPGCREMIDPNNPNGLLVSVKNAEEIAEAIIELCNNPEKRFQMAKNSRLMAEKEFSIEHVVDKTLNVYKKLLSFNRPR